MSESTRDLPPVEAEFAGVQLGDKRREKRLKKVVAALADEPAKSFPKACEGDAGALAGLYRLMNSPRVRFAKVANAHRRATFERCQQEGAVLALHDTTDFSFGGDASRPNLGPVDGTGQGFYLHTTLMAADTPGHRPLGVASAKPWAREPIPRELKGGANRKKRAKLRWESSKPESRRWKRQIELTERCLRGRAEVIHVCDSESDDYDLLASMVEKGTRFVTRQKHDRNLDGPFGKRLSQELLQAPVLIVRDVQLSERKPRRNQPPKAMATHPPRGKRLAKLALSGMRVTLKRPARPTRKGLPESVEINVVIAHEIECPEGEEPVEWVLYTSEPIDTAQQLERVVDIYRARWLIELYFNALKGGCAVEKRQLESLHALLIALAVFLAIAWRLLLMRTLARTEPEAPATAVLSPLQIEVLRASLKKTRLPDLPTVKQALWAVAALGGHLKHNGEPGWRTLARGYEKLLVLEQGWRAAEEAAERKARRSRRKADQGRGPDPSNQ